jgi:hypothetical protein
MYFRQFPVLRGKFDGTFKGVTDIFLRVAPQTPIKNVEFLETTYVQDGETPELLAFKMYEREDYHWILLLINNIVDVREEWPRKERDLYSYCLEKYGENNIYQAVHHYRTTDKLASQGVPKGIIVDYDGAKISSGEHESVTNWDYEFELNEDKREIKYIPKNLVGKFVSEFQRIIRA